MSNRQGVATEAANKKLATRFIHGFNDNAWDAVREVVAPGFVFHHPLGGTVEAGPEGMVSTWAGFKQLSPDSWHPIPIMIAENDLVAVLLPTYGTFTGQGDHAPPPTGGRLDYGMVNIVRIEDGKLAEMWFGMDPLVELRQLGVAPPIAARQPDAPSEAALAAFRAATNRTPFEHDNVVAFGDTVVAMGPPQTDKTSSHRVVEIFRTNGGTQGPVYRHELRTDPPHGGDPAVEADDSRRVVDQWTARVLSGHDRSAIGTMTSPHVLVHPTAMPCEAGWYGTRGVGAWLDQLWSAFPDIEVINHITVAAGDIVAVRWMARGTSRGPFMGLQPTGEPVEFSGLSMLRTDDGRIAEIWETRNTLAILHQLDPDLAAGGHHH